MLQGPATMTHATQGLDQLVTGESSRMAESFAAKIHLETSDLGLFFIMGRTGSPEEAVRSVGGNIVFRLPGNQKLLAVLRTASFSEIQRHQDVALVGPVVVDPQRFARFAALLHLEQEQPTVPAAEGEPSATIRTPKHQPKPRQTRQRRKK